MGNAFSNEQEPQDEDLGEAEERPNQDSNSFDVALNRTHTLALEMMNEFRISKKFCNVLFKVPLDSLPQTEPIYAHGLVLSASSPYFHTFLTSIDDFAMASEQNQIEITIDEKEIDSETLSNMIDFFYTSKLTIPIHEFKLKAKKLFRAACILQVEEIKTKCLEFLIENLDETNCIEIRELAKSCTCLELFSAADTFVKVNFQKVVASDAWKFADFALVLELIKSPDLNIENNEQVYHAVMDWYNQGDPINNYQHMPEILAAIRFEDLSPKFLVETVCKNPLIKGNEFELCRDLIDQAKNVFILRHVEEKKKKSKTTAEMDENED